MGLGKGVTGLEMKLGWVWGGTHLCGLDRPVSLIGGHHTPVPRTGRRKQALLGVNRQDDSSWWVFERA